MLTRLARLRVPLGFVCGIVALALAHPVWWSWSAGFALAVAGEGLRVWAAGHIEKGREITRSGPYRFVRHPLYLGSTLLGVGFALASRSVIVWVVAVAYLTMTLAAAVRLEEKTLDARFDGAYAAYRAGLAAPAVRRFSWARVMNNREYRALGGLAAAFLWLVVRMRL